MSDERLWRRWQVIKAVLLNRLTWSSECLTFWVGGKVPITIVFASLHRNDILVALGKEQREQPDE